MNKTLEEEAKELKEALDELNSVIKKAFKEDFMWIMKNPYTFMLSVLVLGVLIAGVFNI